MVGMVINLIVGVYIPIMRIPVTLGGMTIPNIPQYKELIDPGTCGCSSNHEGPQWLMIWHKTTTWSLICSSQNGPLIVWVPEPSELENSTMITMLNKTHGLEGSLFNSYDVHQSFSKARIVDLGGKKGGENPPWIRCGFKVRFSRDTRSPTFSWSKVPNSLKGHKSTRKKREQVKGLGNL